MSSTQGLHSLATIIKRLEAATSRLEDLAVAQGSTRAKSDDIADEPAPPAVSTPSAPPPPAEVEDPKSVVAYDESVFEAKVKPFVELTKSLGVASVTEQVTLVEKQFVDLRSIVLVAASCQKPDNNGFQALLGPLQADIEGIGRLKDANRKERDWADHLAMVSDGAPCVGWVTVDMKPAPFVGDMKESAQFYGNRVIKNFKDKDAKHVQWVRAYLEIFDALQKYVKDFHTTGLVWNPKGVPVSQFSVTAGSASGAAAPPPPPPPPPPGPPPPPATSSGASGGAGGAAAVFAEINRGEDVTKGLRKVDKSEMTHKNTALRASSVVPASSAPPKRPTKPTKPSSLAGKKPSKFALEDRKWVVEFYENESGLTIDETEISQVVNIFGCKNTTVVVKGKVNAVNMINCTKTSVLIDSVISTVSVTKSPSFAIQITGSAPTIQLDSTDSGQIYLSKECLGVEITTAKCSSINVSIPEEGEEEGVFVERAVPEMMLTKITDGKLVTTIVEHAG